MSIELKIINYQAFVDGLIGDACTIIEEIIIDALGRYGNGSRCGGSIVGAIATVVGSIGCAA
jgi:hypothetical protein